MAFELAARAGAPVLATDLTIRAGDTDYPDPDDPSKVYTADAVLVGYADVRGIELAVQAVIIEVVLKRDPQRPRAWEALPEAVRRRYGCLGQVLIVAPDPAVQAWAHGEIEAQQRRLAAEQGELEIALRGDE